MAQYSLQNLDKWLSDVTGQLAKSNSPQHMRMVGEFLVEKIKIRTRLGYGVETIGGQKSRIKALSPKYVEYRKTFKGLSREAKPSFSNLTLTGSMIDNLEVTNVGSNSITIEPTGSDNRGVSNKNKAAYQQKQGRNFLSLSRQEIKGAREYWVTSLSGLLNK